MTKFPFEARLQEIQADPDPFVSVVFSSLESDFLILPKGPGFIEYPVFERGYEKLKQVTKGFERLIPNDVYKAVVDTPIAMVVLRSMLGFTPPEWAYVTTQRTGVAVSQTFARSQDRKARLAPLTPTAAKGATAARIRALVDTACRLLCDAAEDVGADRIHRLSKADTKLGLPGLQASASSGMPYAMVLYERFLGRPFAGHRDSVSELVGDRMESAIEDVLSRERISYRKTKRAERVEGFDQTPDFIIPSEFNPQVVIEAKITEDDGTARDKVTRIQHLQSLSQRGPGYEVVACIGGRGFAVRRQDMRKMLIATRGKVFTLATLDRLVDCTRLREFRSK